jgi:hypothetical protein
MFDMAKIYLVNHYGGVIGQGTTTLRYVEMYNLMGDPSMPVVEMGPPCPIDQATNPNPQQLTTSNIGNSVFQYEEMIETYTGLRGCSFISLAPFEPLDITQLMAGNLEKRLCFTVPKFTTILDLSVRSVIVTLC